MPDKPWKRTERAVAKRLGGIRIPVTGRARGDAPDIEHPYWSIEVKRRKSIPAILIHAMDQAIASCRRNQIPVVVLVQNGHRVRSGYVILRFRDFEDWFGTLLVDSDSEDLESTEPLLANRDRTGINEGMNRIDSAGN